MKPHLFQLRQRKTRGLVKWPDFLAGRKEPLTLYRSLID